MKKIMLMLAALLSVSVLSAGDNFEIGGGVLSFHAASKGKKVITLKRPCKLVEIFTGETINATSGKVELDMEALTTKVFAIEE